ncbi:ABC transporter permease [Daejeonella oryzae]|uniref:ABC transporter permease n=1 Tax=Daejeonella oryzae TaxID=1122943 RepID=UPI00040EFA73|nr:FtsX-like permease family protein [Daejeonella oryzae]
MARLRQSVIAAVGVTFGITMFITLVSFMTGLNKLLDGLILNRTPHIRLYNEIKPSENQPVNLSLDYADHINMIRSVKPKERPLEIYNSQAIMRSLKEDDRVLGVAPKITAQVFFNVGAIDLNGIINGIDVLVEDQLFYFGDYVTKGNLRDLQTVNNSIILGKGAAEKMLVDIGDVIQVTTARGERLSLKVVGIFQLGIADVDNVQSYASIQTTQKLLGESNNYITDIHIKLKNLDLAPAMAPEYKKLYGTDAIDLQTFNAQFETGTSIRNIITYAVSITLLIVAGFGIYNILNMMIYEKMDSIAILKATGFSGKDVKWIFISISLIIGISGGTFGLIFGYIFSSIINQIPFETAALPTVKTFPINFNVFYYLIGIVFALITTYVAGFFPAKKASQVDPVEIIRGK